MTRDKQTFDAFDTRLAACFHDVPLPEGLELRLRKRLSGATAVSAVQKHGQDARGTRQVKCDEIADVVPARPKYVSRRWLVIAGGTLTAAAVLLVAALVNLIDTSAAYDDAAVRQLAVKFFNSETPEPMNLLTEKSPAGNYPISPAVAVTQAVRWRPIRGFLGANGVAYDISGRGGSRATLYVVKCAVTDLPDFPPMRPGLTTAGCSASVWQSGGLLYVMVVQGGPQTYRRFLDLPRGPVT